MTNTAKLEITPANLSNAGRWIVAAVAVGMIGLGFAVGNGVDNLPSAVGAAQAATLETAVATPSYQVLTVRAASIDDPVAPQDPLAVSY